MRWPPLVLLVIGLGSLLASCEPEDEEEDLTPSGVSITFKTDSGYTYQNTTIGLSDTVRVGVVVDDGEDPLVQFYLMVAYDDSADVLKDTVHINVNPFVFDTILVARAQAGTEEWSFIVQEPDGDLTRRKLLFLVQ